jgi:hypothetical protein
MDETPVPVLPSEAVAFPTPPIDEMIAELVEASYPDVSPEDIGRVEAESQLETGVFRITDPGLADWALRVLHEANIRIDEIDRQFTQFVAGLEAWRETQTKTYRATVAFMTQHLEDYGRRWLATQPPSRPKTLSLPSGKVKTRTTESSVVMEDSDAVLAWATTEEPSLVHEEPRRWVLISEIRDVVEIKVDVDEEAPELITKTLVVHKATGEIVPGLGVKATHTTVTPEPL